MIIDFAYIGEILPALFGATLATLRIAVLAFGLSLLVGLGFAILRLSKRRGLVAGIFAYTEFIRLTPLIVQLFFAYYVLPEIGIQLPAEPTGILVIGLHYATYTSEVFGTGILAVQRGQWESAWSLGLRGWVVWRKIVLPQAIRPMVPALGNYLVQLFKEVPLLSTITVYELLNTANLIAGQSFRYLEVMTLVALIFFVISYGSSLMIANLEERERSR
ncbi:ectoine/hydroxyectoine ABC transporter permease subunit EhuD [Pseudaminobacter sp. 19-2017]|uniref:Ectoine/hydroxyectoine ABC transporter permease subunit EhuD n=1 Tax=Pseudaminobacter soli (ex Zhang et al. 2022) TaxID=2831468 RepID=A0A942DX69_9HYPH|nr:ectoine/hydroxyectoine ABC transporter permease subunit EhuD [Pseudaminobacter soli]